MQLSFTCESLPRGSILLAPLAKVLWDEDGMKIQLGALENQSCQLENWNHVVEFSHAKNQS